MTQQPFGTGFGFRSTAAEVLEGIGLSGRTALVTGGHSGLGPARRLWAVSAELTGTDAVG